MTRHTSTASKKTRTIAQLLTVAVTAALIVAITACQGEQPPPTPRPETEDRSPMQTMEAMAAEIAALQTKAAEPTETTVDEGHSPTEEPPTAVAPTTATATATTTREPTGTLPTPSGRGICSRTPEIQKLILSTLGLASCRSVTTDELYRITYFTDRPIGGSRVDWIEFPLKPGDLNGLVNLERLKLYGNDNLPEGTLAGSGIESLEIIGTVKAEVFDGLLAVSTLKLEGATSLNFLKKPNMRELKELYIEFDQKSPSLLNMQGDELDQLAKLQKLHIAGGFDADNQGATPTPANAPREEYRLPSDIFEHNPELKAVKIVYYIRNSDATEYTMLIDHKMLSQLENMTGIYLSGNFKVQDRPAEQPPLELHPDSPLGEYLWSATQMPTLSYNEVRERATQIAEWTMRDSEFKELNMGFSKQGYRLDYTAIETE